jgi:hypothetical protein
MNASRTRLATNDGISCVSGLGPALLLGSQVAYLTILPAASFVTLFLYYLSTFKMFLLQVEDRQVAFARLLEPQLCLFMGKVKLIHIMPSRFPSLVSYAIASR